MKSVSNFMMRLLFLHLIIGCDAHPIFSIKIASKSSLHSRQAGEKTSARIKTETINDCQPSRLISIDTYKTSQGDSSSLRVKAIIVIPIAATDGELNGARLLSRSIVQMLDKGGQCSMTTGETLCEGPIIVRADFDVKPLYFDSSKTKECSQEPGKACDATFLRIYLGAFDPTSLGNAKEFDMDWVDQPCTSDSNLCMKNDGYGILTHKKSSAASEDRDFVLIRGKQVAAAPQWRCADNTLPTMTGSSCSSSYPTPRFVCYDGLPQEDHLAGVCNEDYKELTPQWYCAKSDGNQGWIYNIDEVPKLKCPEDKEGRTDPSWVCADRQAPREGKCEPTDDLTIVYGVTGFLENYLGFRWYMPNIPPGIELTTSDYLPCRYDREKKNFSCEELPADSGLEVKTGCKCNDPDQTDSPSAVCNANFSSKPSCKDDCNKINFLCFPENLGTHIPKSDSISFCARSEFDRQDPSFRFRFFGDSSNKWSLYNGSNRIDAPGGVQTNKLVHTFLDYAPPYENQSSPEFYSNLQTKSPEEINEFLKWQLGNSEKPIYYPNSTEPVLKPLTHLKINDSNILFHNPDSLNIGNVIAKNLFDYRASPDHQYDDFISLFPEDGLGFDESPASQTLDGKNRGIKLNGEMLSVRDLNRLNIDLLKYPEIHRILSKRLTSVYKTLIDQIRNQESDRGLSQKPLIVGAYSGYAFTPLEAIQDSQNDSYDPDFVNSHQFDENVTLLMCRQSGQMKNISSDQSEPNHSYSESVNAWQTLYKNIGIYEYFYKETLWQMPFPIHESISDAIRFYQQNGVNLFYTQTSTTNSAVYGLNYYVTAKTLWNANQNLDEIKNDYFRNFYGPAKDLIESYFFGFENALKTAPIDDLPHIGQFTEIFTQDLLKKSQALLDTAKNQIEQSSDIDYNTAEKQVFRARITSLQVSLNYAKAFLDLLQTIEKNLKIRRYENHKFKGFQMHFDKDGKLKNPDIPSLAQTIKTYLLQHSQFRSATLSPMLRNLLNDPDDLAKTIIRFHYGQHSTLGFPYLDKADWLQQQAGETCNSQMNIANDSKFDILVYGFDIDRNELKITLKKPLDSENPTTYTVGSNGDGNNRDWVYRIHSEESIASYIDQTNGIISLTLAEDSKQNYQSSSVYSLAIVPENWESSPNETKMLSVFENSINDLRSGAFGFFESNLKLFNQSKFDGKRGAIAVPLQLCF